MKKIFVFSVAFCLLLSFHISLQAAQVLSVNLKKTVDGADVAFTGVCKKAYAHRLKNGLLVTTYDFDVGRVLKGDVGKTFTFTQWGATLEDSKAYSAPYVYGIPRCKVDEECTLFLTAETKLGLRAPVGLGQGKFTTIRGPSGSVSVVNEHGNRSIFGDLKMTSGMTKALSTSSVSQSKPGPISYDLFVNMVDEIKKDEVKKDETKKDKVKKDEIKKDEIKKDEIKKDEVKKGE